MKRRIAALTAVLMAIMTLPALGGVSVDYDRQADFSGYETYSWMEGSPASNPLMDKRIRAAIESRLGAAGLQKVDGKADINIVYHAAIGSERRVNVDDFGYWRGWRGWGGPTTVDVYDVKIGTLIVDILDGASEELVWRGMGEKELSGVPDPDKAEKKINKIVGKMFRSFPPE